LLAHRTYQPIGWPSWMQSFGHCVIALSASDMEAFTYSWPQLFRRPFLSWSRNRSKSATAPIYTAECAPARFAVRWSCNGRCGTGLASRSVILISVAFGGIEDNVAWRLMLREYRRCSHLRLLDDLTSPQIPPLGKSIRQRTNRPSHHLLSST